jgi:ATP-dependent DNA helicase RecG
VLTAYELRAMLADPDSDGIARTASTSNTDEFAEAVCAFANDLPCVYLPLR